MLVITRHHFKCVCNVWDEGRRLVMTSISCHYFGFVFTWTTEFTSSLGDVLIDAQSFRSENNDASYRSVLLGHLQRFRQLVEKCWLVRSGDWFSWPSRPCFQPCKEPFLFRKFAIIPASLYAFWQNDDGRFLRRQHSTWWLCNVHTYACTGCSSGKLFIVCTATVQCIYVCTVDLIDLHARFVIRVLLHICRYCSMHIVIAQSSCWVNLSVDVGEAFHHTSSSTHRYIHRYCIQVCFITFWRDGDDIEIYVNKSSIHRCL